MKIKLILRNQQKFANESLNQFSENIENTNNLLLELDDLNARKVMRSIKKVPLKDRPGNDMFGDKWRMAKGFSSPEELMMKSIHEFLTKKKNYTLAAKSGKKDISFIPPGGGERETKKEIRFDLLYREPPKTDLPQHVLDKIAAGEIKEPKRREFSIQKALGKFKTELGEKYDKWIKFLQGEDFERFTKGEPGEHGTIRPNYKDFLGSDSGEYAIYSRHPIDIVRMSDFSAVKSCHSPDSSHFDDAIDEAIGSGGAVVFYVKKASIDKFLKNNDMAIEEYLDLDEIFADPCRTLKYKNLPVPSGRVRLRNAIITTDPAEDAEKRGEKWWKRGFKPSLEEESVLVPEKRKYGTTPPGAYKQLSKEASELQGDKTKRFMDLILKKIGPKTGQDKEFLKKIEKEVDDKTYSFFKKLGEDLKKFSVMDLSKAPTITKLLSDWGSNYFGDIQPHVSGLYYGLPEEFKKKVMHATLGLDNQTINDSEAVYKFLSNAFRTSPFKEFKLYNKTYKIIPDLGELSYIPLAVPKQDRFSKEMLINHNHLPSIKKSFIERVTETYNRTMEIVYKKNTNFIDTMHIFHDIKLSGGEYTDTPVEPLFSNFILSSAEEHNIEVDGRSGNFGHRWKDEFLKIRDSAFEPALKELESKFNKFINKDILNKHLRSTTSYFYTEVTQRVTNFLNDIGAIVLKRLKNYEFFSWYDIILKLSKKARALNRISKNEGLGSIPDLIRNSVDIKAFLKKIKDGGLSAAQKLDFKLKLAGAIIDILLVDAYEGFLMNMKKLPSDIFFKAKKLFLDVVWQRGILIDMITDEHVKAIKDHAAFLESERKAPEEREEMSTRQPPPEEEDEYVWGGLSENKKPRKKRIIKIKIKGGK